MPLVVLVPGVAFVFGYFAFSPRASRACTFHHHLLLTFAAMLLFFRNDAGFGGNNGFTDFKQHSGPLISLRRARATLY